MFKPSSTYLTLKKSYSKNMPEYMAMRNKYYPEFVFEKNPRISKNEIPVFTLHSVEPYQFEEQLDFLSRNHYQTLNADTFYECLKGNQPVPENAIVLTFDDGWESVWAVAYPLLKKYRFCAVCFLIPGLIRESDCYSPNLEDFWSGKATLEEITRRVRGTEFLCSWKEIQKMDEAGTIDFQSHSMYHSLIFTTSIIEDFIHPGFDFHSMNLNVPVFRENGTENIFRIAQFGMPVYTSEPRMSGKRRYYDDIGLRMECIKYVKENGDIDYFKNRNWRRKLFSMVSEYRIKYGHVMRFESEEEQRENIFTDLSESKRMIEKLIRGKTVNHLCYPWWSGSDLAVEMSQKSGYLTNFWGIDKERRTTNRVGDDPYRVCRFLGDDYIFRLPGEGRKSLRKILEEKLLNNYKGFINKIF